ncbi:hypothetical protein [Alkalicoccobacillus porphyridii]|uniref:Uncharacterized protein n=1 Tax=Alkalicoccobacillus porphyridii TaxID=2597270 RepID=A0A553ZVT4_9BACI|nr:hypothetical protein [Alkalicoccobacillus porphyridii]TSB45590.1 hypothetical protein FN960_15585 [Alkalicoccobacillus porphyridii]
MKEEKDEYVPYHGERSGLEGTLGVGTGMFIPVVTQPFHYASTIIFLIISLPLVLFPIIATLRWRQIDREDSWNRVVAKRLRDTSLVYLLVILAMPVFIIWIFGGQVNQQLYPAVILLFLILTTYFHVLYRRLVTLQGVPLSRDQKKWESQLFRFAGPVAFVALLAALVFQLF